LVVTGNEAHVYAGIHGNESVNSTDAYTVGFQSTILRRIKFSLLIICMKKGRKLLRPILANLNGQSWKENVFKSKLIMVESALTRASFCTVTADQWEKLARLHSQQLQLLLHGVEVIQVLGVYPQKLRNFYSIHLKLCLGFLLWVSNKKNKTKTSYTLKEEISRASDIYKGRNETGQSYV